MTERARQGLNVIIVIAGGLLVLMVARALTFRALADRPAAAAAVATLLTLVWVAVVGVVALPWAKRRFPALSRLSVQQPEPAQRTFTLSLTSLACLVIPILIFHELATDGPGSGESGQIGLAAAGLMFTGFLALGTILGLVALVKREPKRLAWFAVVANAGFFIATAFLVSWKLR